MARRQRLSETQIAELFEPPTEQRELVRHYTLSDADLAAIRRCRGDHNRLGYALMLCYLRFPAAHCASASDRRPRCWRSSQLRSRLFRTASTNTSRRNGTGNAMQSSARSSLGCALLASLLPLS